MSDNKTYKKLSEVEHVLTRTGMYAGSTKKEPYNTWVYNHEKNMVEYTTVEYIPAVLKFFDEIVSNAVDNSVRNTPLKTTSISVDIDKASGEVTVTDNGGIPVELSGYDDNEYIPDLCFGHLRAGSNFNDSEETRTGTGLNGLGSVLTNIFSKKFAVEVCDTKNKYSRTWFNNMSTSKEAKVTEIKSGKHYTKISYLLDYERLNMGGLDDGIYSVLESRVYEVAGCNPHLKVTFNGNPIKINSFYDYCKMYLDEDNNELVVLQDKASGWSVAVSPSKGEYRNVSFANSNRTFVGGTHEQYVLNQITAKLKEHIQKKYKYNITTDQLKNNMYLFVNAVVGNPSFSSQTKERLCSDKSTFINPPTISDKFVKDIIKSEIMNQILDWIDTKKKADESSALRKLNKVTKNVYVENLIDANVGSKEYKTLFIYEGKSAISSFRKFRDPKSQGAISIRGKLMNTYGMSAVDALKNQEINDLFTSMGLKVGESPFNYNDKGEIVSVNTRYDEVCIATDADVDGDAIAGLILCLFNQYFPEFLKHKRITRVMTPLLVITDKKKKQSIFYDIKEYNNYVSKHDISDCKVTYLKGLGSLTDEQCRDMLTSPVKMYFDVDENMGNLFKTWYSDNSQLRKDILVNM